MTIANKEFLIPRDLSKEEQLVQTLQKKKFAKLRMFELIFSQEKEAQIFGQFNPFIKKTLT